MISHSAARATARPRGAVIYSGVYVRLTFLIQPEPYRCIYSIYISTISTPGLLKFLEIAVGLILFWLYPARKALPQGEVSAKARASTLNPCPPLHDFTLV